MSDIKAELRATARARRRSLSRAAPDAADRAAENLPPEVLAAGRSAALYSPMRHEMNTGPLWRRLERAGLRILLPAVVGPAQALAFHEWGRLRLPMPADAPASPAPPGPNARRPDIVFVPLLAWDRDGYRLGYGGGYYDRTLAALRAEASSPVLAVGLAFEGQRIDDLPREAHDQKLDAILTEIGYTRFPDKDR